MTDETRTILRDLGLVIAASSPLAALLGATGWLYIRNALEPYVKREELKESVEKMAQGIKDAFSENLNRHEDWEQKVTEIIQADQREMREDIKEIRKDVQAIRRNGTGDGVSRKG